MAAGPIPGAPMPGAPSPAMPGVAPGAPPAPGGPGPAPMAPPGGPQPAMGQPASPPPPKQPPVTIDAVMALLRDDRMRGFRIDVETDQLVAADEQAEKQQRMEFVTAIGGLLGNAMKLEANPGAAALMPAVGAVIMFAVRGFRVGRTVEEEIENALQGASMLMQQPKPPGPEQAKAAAQERSDAAKLQGIQIKTSAEIAKAQIGIQQAQVEQQDDFARMQMDQQKQQSEHARAERMAQLEERLALMEASLREREHHHEIQRMNHEAMLAAVAPAPQPQPQPGDPIYGGP